MLSLPTGFEVSHAVGTCCHASELRVCQFLRPTSCQRCLRAVIVERVAEHAQAASSRRCPRKCVLSLASRGTSGLSSCRSRGSAGRSRCLQRCVPIDGRLATARSKASRVDSHVQGTTFAKEFSSAPRDGLESLHVGCSAPCTGIARFLNWANGTRSGSSASRATKEAEDHRRDVESPSGSGWN